MIDPILVAILLMSEEKLQEFCEDPKNRANLQSLEGELHYVATIAAARGTYIAMRHGCGCGDQGHSKAKDKMDRTKHSIRKAIGFSYP